MNRGIRLGVVISGAITVSGPVLSSAGYAASPIPADPVVVTATRDERPSFDLPFSIDSLVGEAIHGQQPGVNLSEGLVRVPGVAALNRHNYAQDLQISSRGFGARSTFGIRGVRLLVDGIPATMPDGQGQASTVDMPSAGRIEVLRGPFSAIYGNASGGVIQVFSEAAPATPAFESELLAASYGTNRAGVKLSGRQDTFDYLGSLARFRTDGYREHSAATRESGALRMRWTAADDTRAAVHVSVLRQPDTQDPLGLTRMQLEQNPRQAGSGAGQFDTRKRIDHAQAGVTIERRLSPVDRLTLTGYGGRRDVRQYLAFAGAGPTQSGGVVDLDRGFHGVGTRWTHDGRMLDKPLTVTLGIERNEMAERRRGFVNDNGSAGGLRRDEDDRVNDFDQYAQIEWLPAPRWVATAGVRRNRVAFESKDFYVTGNDNPDDSGRAVYEKTNPMLGVLYKWRDTVNLYANAGRGFETPTFAELAYRPDGGTGLNFALRPSTSRNLEAGIKAYLTPRARLNAALFRVRVEDEIVPGLSPAPGRSTFANAERSARDGFEVSIDSRIGRNVEMYLAYTWIDARFQRYVNSAGMDLSGNTIPGVPRTMFFGEIKWRPAHGWLTALEVRRVDRIPVNDANSDFTAPYTVANWRIGYEQRRGAWKFQPYLRIDNLFGKAYVGSVIVNASGGAYFEPAPRRALTAGLRAGVDL